jgi:AraC family transcriptional regulator
MVDRAIPVLGAVNSSPCVAIEANGAIFTLYPPTPFAISVGEACYKLLLPFGSAAMDVLIGERPTHRLQLRPGDLVAAQPGSQLSLRHVAPLEFLLITIDPERARAVALSAAGPTWSVPDLLPWSNPAAAALGQEMRRTMIGEALPPAAYLASLVDALVARVALASAEQATRGRRAQIAPAVLARVLQHIDAELARTIEVGELAQVAGLSQAHFSRVFAKATGDPPRRFVTKRRICRAREMLSSGSASLAEVAVRTGFANQAHMSTVFAREVGMSPARYRSAFATDRAPV